MYKLVIVDDEYYIRQMLIKGTPWHEMEYEVVAEAEDGQSALKAITDIRPDAALVDINLPKLNGLELIESIGKIEPDICIVILTAYERFSYAKSAIRLNVFEYLLKPIDPEEIRDTFTRLKPQIERKRLERARRTETNRLIRQGGGEIIDRIQQDILSEYQRVDMSVKLLANRYHMSEASLCSLYKKHSGGTIMENVTKRRIQMAKILICENPRMPFGEIADAVGYEDPLYFSKVFRKRTGMSPSQYRQENVKE